MNKKIAVIGHRRFLPSYVYEYFEKECLKQIKNNNFCFFVGTHGDFDEMAYNILSKLKKINNSIQINIVTTSLRKINPKVIYDGIVGKEIFSKYENANFIMYDIEETHFKRRITESNKKMIDECNILICYVNPNKTQSGAKYIYNYAIKNNKIVINLYNSIYEI